VLKPLDEAVTKAAIKNDIVYTRYADDLTFSGKSETPKILPFVCRVLAQYGYKIKEKKTNLFRKGRRQIVTGLVVNEKPNLPRKIRRELRAAINLRSKDDVPHWHGKPMNDAELIGRVSYLKLVQPKEAQKYLDILINNNKSTH
jgi:retron-type reverse transcriptase